ncbi:MAG: hypothetical protein BGO26_06760 [Actinobacteria bacterium 69-20]|nr:hypothetical protein [Actinomycetota bacterium]OJV28135.1 MAG: hypothetical protein BGO26_06760 [Actinobacteria bacterium 69-20]
MPLHDDPTDAVALPDGRYIRNLTDAEYAATYDDPGTTGGHEIPADVLAAAMEGLTDDAD